MMRLLISIAFVLTLAGAAHAQTIAGTPIPAGYSILVAAVYATGGSVVGSPSLQSTQATPTDPDTDVVMEGLTPFDSLGGFFLNNNDGTDITIRRAEPTINPLSDYFEGSGPYAGADASVLIIANSDRSAVYVFDDAGGGFGRWENINTAENFGSNEVINRDIVIIIAVQSNLLPATDNCNMYLGDINLESPGDYRLGAVTPTRIYYGTSLVCGDAP